MTLYYGVFGNGEHSFTTEKRIADAWVDAVVIVNPTDDAGEAYTGLASQTLSTTIDELGALVIDVTHHDDIPTAVALVYNEAPPTSVVSVDERVAALELENNTLMARLEANETAISSIIAWARTLTE